MTQPFKKSDEPSLKETADDLYEIARGKISTFEEEFQRAREFVQRNPVIAVAGAAALGYYLGKLFRKKKYVYVQKVSKP